MGSVDIGLSGGIKEKNMEKAIEKKIIQNLFGAYQ